MNNFKFFRRKCKHTEFFDCQIALKDYKLLFIENDLEKLLAVEENDVFYFTGGWKHYRYNRGKKTNIKKFIDISSDYRKEDEYYFYEYWDSTEVFNIEILYALFDRGVDLKILESYIPQLFELYDALERQGEADFAEDERNLENKYYKAYKHNYNVFLMNWDYCINGWRKKCDLALGMNDEDKVLYKQVEDMIGDCLPEIFCDIPPGCEFRLFNIVWENIQIVRNGGREEEVYAYLLPHCWKHEYADPKLQKKYDIRDENQRRELAKKLVELIGGEITDE